MSDGDPSEHSPLLRSFGRRRGRKLSPRQEMLMTELLPQLQINLADPPPARITDLFPAQVQRVWLEIGFGGAEHLLWQAETYRDTTGLIGAEPFEEGMVKALHGVEAANLKSVRLHPDDARPLLDWLPPTSIDRAFVLFPDPWPKKRHAKRRLVSPALLTSLARVMRPGGELRLATDIAPYAREMLLAVRHEGSFDWTAAQPLDWRQRPDDWPETRYERKAGREGRRANYFRFIRR
jgi:tRNA (guanine-N7-)-methyltransferase